MSHNRNTAARAMHDLGLAAWFGGSLMGAIGLNGAAADVRDPIESTRVAQAGWGRWTPVGLAAIGLHLAGGAWLLTGNKSRIMSQQGVLAATATKAGLTAAALGMTAYTRVLGEDVMKAGDTPSHGATTPSEQTEAKAAAAQRKLHTLQWTVPALTGAVLVLNAYMGEQQRMTEQLRGGLARGTRQFGKALATGALLSRYAGKAWGKKKKTQLKAGAAVGAIKHAPRVVAKSEAAKWATKTGVGTGRTAVKAGKKIAEVKAAKALVS